MALSRRQIRASRSCRRRFSIFFRRLASNSKDIARASQGCNPTPCDAWLCGPLIHMHCRKFHTDGTICHLLLEIPGLVGLIGFCSLGILPYLGASKEARAWAPLFLLFALMWLPFVLISGWAFFYLRRLRKSYYRSDQIGR